MTIKSRKYQNEPLIHHSDRGIQYCCDDYQRVLAKHKIQVSMTESYDKYSNAVAERVNGNLKDEFMLKKYDVDDSILRRLIQEYINVYNWLIPLNV